MMLHFYRGISDVFEYCFNIETIEMLTKEELEILKWLLAETFEPDMFLKNSFFSEGGIIEVGPRMNFATAWNTNAVAVCHACGLTKIKRVERSRRHLLSVSVNREKFIENNHDRMTEMEYPEPLITFETGIKPEPVLMVPLIKEGPDALRKINEEMGLGMDDWDIDYYYNLFAKNIGRNSTNVECFDLGQANSEHSRHWFFKGKMVIDGKSKVFTLLDLVKLPLHHSRGNSIIAFSDNSSGIRGYEIKTIVPEKPGFSSRFRKAGATYHIIFTAETHNFPSGVAPFPGAETGTGGRIRDVEATGRGALVVAGTAAYCVGNLLIPGYELPWENKDFIYPSNLASPLQIEIKASNGASDYGNKFGEPVIQGFTRSFGLRLPGGERREWIKPIMFTGGIGQIDSRHIKKKNPRKGMLIVQIGGPAYRIGVGGGAASSMIQGQNVEELDFKAVQRGDAEMEQKMNRVIRACVEMGSKNPIESLHDQGAGGPSNVIKELINPAGGRISIRKIEAGDKTLSLLEVWGAEYQERNALLIDPERIKEFKTICVREKVNCEVLGKITGDGKIVVYDSQTKTTPVNLELSKILGKIPQKVFRDNTIQPVLKPLELPENLTVKEALERVLKLVSVGSKRFLTNKVDRSVTGLIAQQQCCGPVQLTVSDCAVIAQSHLGLTGAVISVGEKPISGLINPEAMGRMAVAEAITNMAGAKITRLEDIKCSVNWMWAAKLSGEAANIYAAAGAMSRFMIDLGIAADGGKDSLSMAAKVGNEIVKSPGQLVISAYAPMKDILKVVTPDIKRPGESRLLFIDLAKGKRRLGGSAIAQCYGQIGDECPDVEDPELLKNVFCAIQAMIENNLILSGHDTTGDGLLIALLEMAFAGNCGLTFTTPYSTDKKRLIPNLFAEECGIAIEVAADSFTGSLLVEILIDYGIYQAVEEIGRTVKEPRINIIIPLPNCTDECVLTEDMRVLRQIWEETSYQLERLQRNPECADEEKGNIYDRPGMKFSINFGYGPTESEIMALKKKPKIAIIREEGSNGDREMASAFYQAGFECWDVTMTDLLAEKADLADFRGVAFVGGFSYADVLDSAKGWAGVIRFNKKLRTMFDRFYNRPDTFSLGVCNGCQLEALLGWVTFKGLPDIEQPRFIQNRSGRFESRWSEVKILPSPAIVLKGMEDSKLGIWIAHGEGRLYFPKSQMLNDVREKLLAPIRYVDDKGHCTEVYPFNPNGSPVGIAALCSPDGRHLAMMPHPERSFLKWQWPYQPEDWKSATHQISPWLKMFQNAREWCEKIK